MFLAISACDVLDSSCIGRTTSHRLSGFSCLSFGVPIFFTGCCESDAFSRWIYPMRRNVPLGEYRRIDVFSSIVSGSARIRVLFASLVLMHRYFESRLHWYVACAEKKKAKTERSNRYCMWEGFVTFAHMQPIKIWITFESGSCREILLSRRQEMVEWQRQEYWWYRAPAHTKLACWNWRLLTMAASNRPHIFLAMKWRC